MKSIIITVGLITCTLVSFGQRHMQKDQSKKLNGVCLLVGGIAFNTAAMLEGSKAYQTYSLPATSNPQTRDLTKKTKPFSQQYPRNIMFSIGIGFTVTGIINLIK